MSEAIRLDKHLVTLLHCSRGDAQRYIEGGWVLVEGEVVEQPQFKVLGQQVTLHPDATLEPSPAVTLLLNLPTGFDTDAPTAPTQLITPASQALDDQSGIRRLKRHFINLQPTAPLEAGASGLLVFTHDWRVVRRLVENNSRNEQEYIVEVDSEITPEQLEQLSRTLMRYDRPLPPAKVSRQSETQLRFALKAPRLGQIAFMCQSVGLTPTAMRRIRIGRVSMGKLPPGQWRYLPTDQLF